MLLRLSLSLSITTVVAAIALAIASSRVDAATAMPHGQNASGIPYYNGQIKVRNMTYYVDEVNMAMYAWALDTGRAYLAQQGSSDPLGTYIVYAGSQDDTNYAAFFGIHSCAWLHDHGYSGWRSFMFGIGQLNNDSAITATCLFVTYFGYSPAFDQVNQATQIYGIAHEMGHSLHLADDNNDNGAMNQCWCYGPNTTEGNYVNFIYWSPP